MTVKNIDTDYQDLKFEYRMNPSDSWGNCMQWLFSIADYMTDKGICVPDQWQFRQGISGSDTDQYEYQSLQELNPDSESLEKFAALLWRLSRILKAMGKDY